MVCQMCDSNDPQKKQPNKEKFHTNFDGSTFRFTEFRTIFIVCLEFLSGFGAFYESTENFINKYM